MARKRAARQHLRARRAKGCTESCNPQTPIPPARPMSREPGRPAGERHAQVARSRPGHAASAPAEPWAAASHLGRADARVQDQRTLNVSIALILFSPWSLNTNNMINVLLGFIFKKFQGGYSTSFQSPSTFCEANTAEFYTGSIYPGPVARCVLDSQLPCCWHGGGVSEKAEDCMSL